MARRIHALVQDAQHANSLAFHTIEGAMASNGQFPNSICTPWHQRRQFREVFQSFQCGCDTAHIGFCGLKTKAVNTVLTKSLKVSAGGTGDIKNGHVAGETRP